jgi:hypothetical protein
LGGFSLSKGLCWFISGVAEEYHVMLRAPMFGLPNVSQPGLEWHLAVAGALLSSQCNVAWRSFLQARGSVCWSFGSPWCFISAKCGFSIQQGFWVTELTLCASAP